MNPASMNPASMNPASVSSTAHTTNHTVLGLISGLGLGFAAAFGGFGAFVIVVLFATAGLAIGRYLDGQLDLSALTGRGSDRLR